jgi:hypothetical protein
MNTATTTRSQSSILVSTVELEQNQEDRHIQYPNSVSKLGSCKGMIMMMMMMMLMMVVVVVIWWL